MNKFIHWIRNLYMLSLRQILSILAAVVTFFVAYYGILTINLKLSTNWFFKWLPLVCNYNKRKIALNNLMKLDIDIASDSEKISSIEHFRGTLNKNETGFKELLVILRGKLPVIPDALYYEEIRQVVRFDKVKNEVEKHIIASLKYTQGTNIVVLETDSKSPFEYLNSEINFRLHEVIASITVICLFIVFALTIFSILYKG